MKILLIYILTLTSLMFSMDEQFTVGHLCINNTTNKILHCMILSTLNGMLNNTPIHHYTVVKKISLNPNEKSSVTSNILTSIKIGQEYKDVPVWGKKIIIIVRNENHLVKKISTKRYPGVYDIAYKGEDIVIKKNECSDSNF